MDAKVKITKGESEAWVMPESVYVWEKLGWKLDKASVKDAAKSGEKTQEEIEAQISAPVEAENIDKDNTNSGRPESAAARRKRGSTAQ